MSDVDLEPVSDVDLGTVVHGGYVGVAVRGGQLAYRGGRAAYNWYSRSRTAQTATGVGTGSDAAARGRAR